MFVRFLFTIFHSKQIFLIFPWKFSILRSLLSLSLSSASRIFSFELDFCVLFIPKNIELPSSNPVHANTQTNIFQLKKRMIRKKMSLKLVNKIILRISELIIFQPKWLLLHKKSSHTKSEMHKHTNALVELLEE